MKPSAVLSASLLVAGMLLMTGFADNVRASVIVTVLETNGDVVFSGSGTLNVSGLTSKGSGNLLAGSDFGEEFFLGANPTGFLAVDFYGATGEVSAPVALFAGDIFLQPDSGDGMRFGIAIEAFGGQVDPAVTVPAGYVSGNALMGTSTFSDETLASLGLIAGSYTWSWSNDSLTMNIGQVPAPATFWLLSTALIAGWGWIRRKAA